MDFVVGVVIFLNLGDPPAVRIYDHPYAGRCWVSWAGEGAGTISVACVVALSALRWPLNAAAPNPKPFESGMMSSGHSFSHSTNISYVPGDHVSSQFSPHHSRGAGE